MLALGATILASLKRLPWWAYAALALIAAVLLSYRMGYNARDERADREMAAVIEAQGKAREAQIAVNRAAQERYDELAERNRHAHETTRAVVRDATDRHIAARGVQNGQCVASGASAPASGDSSGIPVEVPAQVIMDTADVRACGDLYAYAISAHEWAVGLVGE